MTADVPTTHQTPGYCGLCIARCGTIATVENGRFTRLDPDPTHPTGAAICAKGRAAPELVYHKDRLTRPLRRRRSKGDLDPGWEEISWDDAVDRIARKIRKTRDATWIATEKVDGKEVPVNRTDAIAFLGGAQNTNEECYLFQKAARLLGLAYVEHQARL